MKGTLIPITSAALGTVSEGLTQVQMYLKIREREETIQTKAFLKSLRVTCCH